MTFRQSTKSERTHQLLEVEAGLLERDHEGIRLLARERCCVVLEQLILTLKESRLVRGRFPMVVALLQTTYLLESESPNRLATLGEDGALLFAQVLEAVRLELESMVVLEVGSRHTVSLLVFDRFELNEERASLVRGRRHERVVFDKVVVVADHFEWRCVAHMSSAVQGEFLASEAVGDCVRGHGDQPRDASWTNLSRDALHFSIRRKANELPWSHSGHSEPTSRRYGATMSGGEAAGDGSGDSRDRLREHTVHGQRGGRAGAGF